MFRPDITGMVDWALKINYLSIYRLAEKSWVLSESRVVMNAAELGRTERVRSVDQRSFGARGRGLLGCVAMRCA